MAYQYVAPRQTVDLNLPVLFNTSIPCRNGNVFHENGEGIFILNGKAIKCNCPNASAQYLVQFVANIALPEGGTVGPIALALAVDGNIVVSTRAISTPEAVQEFNNISIAKVVTIPKVCGCENVSIIATSGIVTPATGTPAPTIDVADGNLLITRIS